MKYFLSCFLFLFLISSGLLEGQTSDKFDFQLEVRPKKITKPLPVVANISVQNTSDSVLRGKKDLTHPSRIIFVLSTPDGTVKKTHYDRSRTSLDLGMGEYQPGEIVHEIMKVPSSTLQQTGTYTLHLVLDLGGKIEEIRSNNVTFDYQKPTGKDAEAASYLIENNMQSWLYFMDQKFSSIKIYRENQISKMEKFIKKYPDSSYTPFVKAAVGLGILHHPELKKRSEAKKYVTEAIKDRNVFLAPWANRWYAEQIDWRENTEKAINELKLVIKRWPNHRVAQIAHLQIAWIYHKVGKNKKALKWINEVLEGASNNPLTNEFKKLKDQILSRKESRRKK